MYKLHYGHLQDCEIPFVMDAFVLKNLNLTCPRFRGSFVCLHHVFMYVVAGTMHGVLIKGGVLISGVFFTLHVCVYTPDLTLKMIFYNFSLSLSPAPEAAPPGPSDQGLLIDVFGGPPPAAAPAADVTTPPTGMGLSPGAEEGFMRFLLKNNGVLFENEMLQIGVKSEYKKNLG